MQGFTVPLSATGQILIASFVKLDPAVKFGCTQCTGPQDLMVGISPQGSYLPPGGAGSTATTNGICTPATLNGAAISATNPYQIAVYAPGSRVRLQLSANCASISPGQLLTSDRDGTGIDLGNPAIADLTENYAGAYALSGGSAGQFVQVIVLAPFPIGIGGSTGVIRVSLTPTTVGPASTSDQTFSVAGLVGAPNTPVDIAAEALTANLGIVNAIMVSQGSIKIRFINPTAASIVPSAQFFDIVSV